MIDIENINLNDKKVWDVISSGKVKGLFQVESNLGKVWCKNIAPSSIEELAALISVIRPGCLKAFFEGKSMTQHFADRKNGEPVPSLHPLIDDILTETYGIIVYQEQAMKIAQRMAGFDLKEADDLRKAIGKKKADLMKEIRSKFIDGAIKKGIQESKAIEVFDIIEKSARYSFNKSHAVSYAYITYWSAYLRCYHPKDFFENWLMDASDKVNPDLEKKQLILAAKAEDIEVSGPSIEKLRENFFWDDDSNCIRFGMCNIKNFGHAHLEDLIYHMKNVDTASGWLWIDILSNVLIHVNKRAVENLISVGALAITGKSRTSMLHEYSCFLDLTKKEQEGFVQSFDKYKTLSENLSDFINLGVKKDGGYISSTSRLEKVKGILDRLNQPGRSLKDNPAVYSKIEEKLLGFAVCHNELDACQDASYANATCIEVVNGKFSESTLAVVVTNLREHQTKNKDTMAFLSVEDNSGELENVVIFPDVYEQYKDIIYNNATVLITGEIKDKKRKSFIVSGVFSI